MPTTVHIPPRLLRSVDRRARSLKVSRNRFIVDALERRLADEAAGAGWSPGFFERMERRGQSKGYRQAVDQLFEGIAKARKSKRIVHL